jgi:two-component system, LuxR family, response regulator FixJ
MAGKPGMKPADKLAECIYIVAGDATLRNELSAILRPEGFHVSGFTTGVACLAAMRRRRPACIILDAHLPDGSARELVAELRRRKCTAPVFIACAEAKDAAKFEAVRARAVDFIDKPFDPATLVGRVRDAIAGSMRHISNPAAPRPVATHFPGCEMLTPREHEVLALVAGGASNKEAGRRLGISPRTVEVHRARIMEKLGARNTVELVHRVLADRS